MKKAYFLDALFFSLMVGAGETYFTAYSLRLGHGELKSGLLATFPLIIGGIVQILAPIFINRLHGPKAWTVLGAFLQALIFIPLGLAPEIFTHSYTLLFLLVSLYWIFNLGISPSWCAWVAELVPIQEHQRFFRIRNTITGIGSLLGLIGSGISLQLGSAQGTTLNIFGTIFIICFLLRTASTLALLYYPSVQCDRSSIPEFKLKNFTFPPQYEYLKKLTWFTSLFKLGVFFSASFFSPYMLKILGLSYSQYMTILSASVIGRVFFLRLFKRKFAEYNITKVYFFSALGVSLIPLMWIISPNFIYLFLLEVFTGMFWGGFELSFTLIGFKEAPPKFQAQYMSVYNFIHTMAIALGVCLGGLYFRHYQATSNIYYQIFLISTVLRFSSLAFFPGIRPIHGRFGVRYFLRLVGIRPNLGTIERPLSLLLRKQSTRPPSENQDK